MASQTMKNRSKQRGVGSKGGLDRGLNEPNLSGAYIRSLVKQLTSSKNHANSEDLMPKSSIRNAQSGTNGSGANMENSQDSNGTHKHEVSSSITPVLGPEQQQKKQVRRRPHTRKTSQDCPLDIAEARREIVTALHLHRAAANSKLSNQTESQKPRKNTNASSNHNAKLYSQSAGMSSNGSRCNSCMSKGAVTLHREAKAITICGHLLCWTCLSEYLLYLSTWVVRGCPVCDKPLTTNHIFPIALGVPILNEQSSACTSSVLLQSSPLLINPLPLPQPAWSTTGPTLGLSMDGMDISQDMNINYISERSPVLHKSFTGMDNATSAPFAMVSQSTKSDISIQQPDSIKSTWHVAMDEEELAEIRSLGDQHEMEWSDSVDLATSTWWFTFLKASESNPEMNVLNQADFDISDHSSLENILMQDEVGFYPELLEDPLSAINESQYISSELPEESLWPDEWFDYDWFQDLNNQEEYHDILEIELDENHFLTSSELFKENKPASDQEISDDITDLHRSFSWR